jgi:hypothetical protein
MMMIKYLYYLALCLSSSLSMAAPVLSMSSLQNSIGVGATTTVSIDLTGAVDVYAYQFDVLFTPGVLSASQAISGFFLSDGTGFFSGTVDSAGGSISFISDAVIGSSSGVSGSGNLATLVFTGLSGGLANLQFANLIFLNSSLTDIPGVSTVGTSISVSAGNSMPISGTALLAVTALLAAGFAKRIVRPLVAQP